MSDCRELQNQVIHLSAEIRRLNGEKLKLECKIFNIGDAEWLAELSDPRNKDIYPTAKEASDTYNRIRDLNRVLRGKKADELKPVRTELYELQDRYAKLVTVLKEFRGKQFEASARQAQENIEKRKLDNDLVRVYDSIKASETEYEILTENHPELMEYFHDFDTHDRPISARSDATQVRRLNMERFTVFKGASVPNPNVTPPAFMGK
jgi:chromosome segregation ATPase